MLISVLRGTDYVVAARDSYLGLITCQNQIGTQQKVIGQQYGSYVATRCLITGNGTRLNHVIPYLMDWRR